MNFKSVSKLSNLLAKDYAGDFIRLLVTYKSISASEAASRLELHIKTAQDFLEGLTEMNLLKREEVYEKKRPYFRYTMISKQLTITINFSDFYDAQLEKKRLNIKIKERINAPVVFTPAGSGQKIASIMLILGEGRKRKERKISLTDAQGTFLYYLPFPTEKPLSITSILAKGELDKSYIPEILDMVELLESNGIIDIN
jgi:hypothetical protein